MILFSITLPVFVRLLFSTCICVCIELSCHPSGIRSLPCVSIAVLALLVYEEQDREVYLRRGLRDIFANLPRMNSSRLNAGSVCNLRRGLPDIFANLPRLNNSRLIAASVCKLHERGQNVISAMFSTTYMPSYIRANKQVMKKYSEA